MSLLTEPLAAVAYPETDGKPRAENTVQYRYLTTIKGGLEVVFRDRQDVFVAGDLFWFPVEGSPELRTAPDVMAVIGRPKGDRSSYRQWEEANIPPQIVFEITSPSNSLGEIAKTLFYEQHGVEEYYVYDPDRGELDGWLGHEGGFKRIPEMRGWMSPRLEVRFELEGKHLRVYDPQGTPFATYEELADQAMKEATRADQEAARAERLAAPLRDLGVEPE